MVRFAFLASLIAATSAFDFVSEEMLFEHVAKGDEPTYTTETASSTEVQRIRKAIGAINGRYVAECNTRAGNYYNSSDLTPYSTAFTSIYTPKDEEDDYFEVDYTTYEGKTCFPGDDENQVIAKYNIKGRIKFHGVADLAKVNKTFSDVYSAEWIVVNSTFLFPDSPATRVAAQGFVDELNDACQCGQKWVIGKLLTFHSGDCKLKPNKNYPFYCHMADGTNNYANYKLVDVPNYPDGYISSVPSVTSTLGWSNYPSSPIRHGLPQGNVVDPSSCNVITWFKCQDGVEYASDVCQGCTGIECIGCMFRAEEEDITSSTFWTYCCPCDYQQAQILNRPWMKVPC